MLDENLYALTLSFGDGQIDFNEHGTTIDNEAVYQTTREDDATYLVTDPVSLAVLARLRIVSSKLRVVELSSPPATIELKNTGLLSWEHRFRWESHILEWKRENTLTTSTERGYTLWMNRKPEADWMIASYRPSPRLPLLQFLDYQLKRVEIADTKGLELVVIATLSSFFDLRGLTKNETPSRKSSPSARDSTGDRPASPPIPPPGQSDTSEPQIVEETEPNDFVIRGAIPDDLFVQACLGQLEDPSLEYVTIRAESEDVVPKAVRIAAEVKIGRLKVSGERLHQYITETESSHIPRISLSAQPTYVPPQRIQIWLSRLPLDELEPKVPKPPGSPATQMSAGSKNPSHRLHKSPSSSSQARKVTWFGRSSTTK